MRWKTCVVMSLLALAVAGCGANAPRDEVGGSGPPVWVEPTCPRGTGNAPGIPGGVLPTRGEVPADFVTTWVLRCRTDVRDLPDRGTWTVQVAERADTPASDLVDQLRRASDSRSTGECTLEMVLPPYFVLVDAGGKAVLPAVPTDRCGKPRADALKALEALPFRILSETPVNQVQSQQSLDSGCSESWKDMLVIDADSATPGPAAPLWSTPVSTLRVCVYDTTGDGEPPVGQFASGHEVAGDAAKALLAALDEAGPADACSTPHTRFAVLTADGAAGWAMAELDGCRRLLRPDNTLGRLDGSAVAALTG